MFSDEFFKEEHLGVSFARYYYTKKVTKRPKRIKTTPFHDDDSDFTETKIALDRLLPLIRSYALVRWRNTSKRIQRYVIFKALLSFKRSQIAFQRIKTISLHEGDSDFTKTKIPLAYSKLCDGTL